MASVKQIIFIQHLLAKPHDPSLDDTVEARSIRCGMGDELSVAQASRFIDALLSYPKRSAVAEYADDPATQAELARLQAEKEWKRRHTKMIWDPKRRKRVPNPDYVEAA